jgi:hypothetical protein
MHDPGQVLETGLLKRETQSVTSRPRQKLPIPWPNPQPSMKKHGVVGQSGVRVRVGLGEFLLGEVERAWPHSSRS